jgi:hypothetical protein
MNETKMAAARRAKARFTSLMPKDLDVVGIGIGLKGDDPAVKVNLGTAPKDDSLLPETIDGVPVVYDYVGKILKR